MPVLFYIKKNSARFIAIIYLLSFPLGVFSQNKDDIAIPYVSKVIDGYRVTAVIENNDTIPYIVMPWVIINGKMSFTSRRKYAEWTRLKYNVKKVYPYAILAAAKLKEFDLVLATIPKEADRKAYLKKSEKELQKEFGEELKGLSINQGKILMKLIDRETGKTTYTIIKDMRGNFNAFMWQSLATLFGSSMKQNYDLNDPYDRQIELAIKQIEAGEF
ncbi:MAG TPA: DUF4294 domain-containing protein [Bacteroidia bacterium]|jgi:hypothetical protein|nr:DUF4294 domain-containing protein [Bacteroidia bacterium]